MPIKGLKTVKGRFEELAKILPEDISQAERAKIMMMFYAGFASCLEFNMEIADASVTEREAVWALQEVQREVDQIAAAAQLAFSPVRPS